MANNYTEYRKWGTMVPPKQGIYEYSTTKNAPLGTRLALPDGRVFRYAANSTGAELAPGKFVKAVEILSANAFNHSPSAAVAIGAYTLTLAGAQAITTGADGWLQINDATGEGIQYKIKSTAANASTSTSTDIVLYDPIATALVTTSEGTIIFNPYYATAICTAITDIILGVPPITVPVSTSALTYYYWLQTWGIAPVWQEGTPSAGQRAQMSVTNVVAGVTVNSAHTSAIIGYSWYAGLNTEYKPVFLTIAP